MFSINIKGGVPIYEQLGGHIAALITTGVLQKEEKLPTVREVAKQLGVNPNTVQKAYQQLEFQGLIYSVPAKGSYVSSDNEGITLLRSRTMKSFLDVAKNALNCGIEKPKLIEAINTI